MNRIIQRVYLKYISLLLVPLIFSLQLFSQTHIRDGEVSGEWNKTGSPYIIDGHIFVPVGKVLNIRPGTVIRFSGPFNIQVRGSIFARGEEKSPIEFGSVDTISKDKVLNWKGIKITGNKNRKDTAWFSWCHFSNGNATGDNVEHCRGGAIFADSSRYLKIEKCKFFRNTALIGGAVYARNSNLFLEGCRFEQNRSLTDGGAVCLVSGKARVYNNIFLNNNAYSFGGALMIQNMKSLLANNLIVENNSRFGAGIALVNDTSSFINNTIAENISSSHGGGIHMEKSATRFINSIIWGNKSGKVGKQAYLFDEAYPRFWFCNLEDGTIGIKTFKNSSVNEDFNNIDLDPAFVQSDTTLYALTEGSPCIDYGIPDTSSLYLPKTDLAYRHRINGSSIDIGAYEYGASFNDEYEFNEEEENFDQLKLKLRAYPNPSKGKFRVLVSNPEHKSLVLSIISSSGNVLIQTPVKNTDEVFILPVEIQGKPGLYLMNITDHQKRKLNEMKVVIN